MFARLAALAAFVCPFALASACLLAVASPAAAEDLFHNPKPVRSSTGWGEQLIAEGCLKSPSFRALVARLEQSNVIVYVQPAWSLRGVMAGMTELVGQQGDYRYIRISIALRAARKQLIAMIGHELQHAAEIAGAPDVVDAASLEAYYRRAGEPSVDGYDTKAARDMGDVVYDELWRWRPVTSN